MGAVVVLMSMAIPSLLAPSAWARSEVLNLGRRYPALEAENNVWIGTPKGLLEYNPGDDALRRPSLPPDAPGVNVREIHYSEEWLWCVLDSGLAALHIRSNEWLFFDDSNGLPSAVVNGLDFYGDYVWIAADDGAARFDILIEEWETYDEARGLPDVPVNDVLIRGDAVWLVTNHNLSEYDPQFERWRHYELGRDTTEVLGRAFPVGDDIWLVSNQGLIRFDPQLGTQQGFYHAPLNAANLLELVIENDTIWAVSRQGLYVYDQASGVWQEFEGNAYLREAALLTAYVDRSEIWVLTTKSVMVWNRENRAWEILDYASGLSASGYRGIYVSGGMVFLVGPERLDYRTSAEDTWRTYAVDTGGVGQVVGGRPMRDLFDNEEGGFVRIGDRRWGWDGTRVTLIQDYTRRFKDDGDGVHGNAGSADDGEIVSTERLDVKSQLDLGRGRTITGFYNDVDYSETMYGVRYRSREDEILREVVWGDFRREPGSVPFGETASLFGSEAWLQAGAKTERYKRSLVTLKGQYGERRSRKTYEHFDGASETSTFAFPDLAYLRNIFYSIPGLPEGAVPQLLEVYVDDLNAGNSTPNTLEHHTIGGLTGDFDLLRATEDYYFYETAGVLRFTSSVGAGWTIAVRYLSGGIPVEVILQYGETVSTAMSNFYSLGGTGMIPHSLSLTIKDSLGVEVALAEFGIDGDGDGWVDSDWVDYAGGILFFPVAEPFPPEVYDPDQPKSVYSLAVSFTSDLALIRLEHRDLVRGSEVITLDGRVAEGGNDYVLDYTSGTLVFVREGVVSTDTRIEIEYEYYESDETDRMASAMLNFSPSDDFYVQGDWVRLSRAGMAAADEDSVSNLIALHSEMRHAVGGYDLRVIPGLAYDPEARAVSASHLEGLISSTGLRLMAKYEDYKEGYANLYRPRTVVGTATDNLEVFATADLTQDLRLSGDWHSVHGLAAEGEAACADRAGGVSLLFHSQAWPGLEVSYQDFETRCEDHTADRYYVESRLDYQVPSALSGKLLLERLRAEGLLRKGRLTSEGEAAALDEQEFRRGQVRLTASVSDQFQLGFFYRRNDSEDVTAGKDGEPIARAERVLLSLSHEEWRVLQVNLRVENSQDQGFHRGSPLKDVNLSQYAQVNLRLSPGQLWSRLGSHYFEFDVNQAADIACATSAPAGSWLWQAFHEPANRTEASRVTRAYSVKNEYRPDPSWYVFSFLERNRGDTDKGGSNLESRYWQWTERLEAKLGFKTRLRFQYRQYSQDTGYERTLEYYEPSMWVEHRWTSDLQNMLNLLYRRELDHEARIKDATDVYDARYDLILRREGVPGIRRMEARQGLSVRHTRTSGYRPERTYILSSSSSLDFYPLHSIILRFQLDLTRNVDRLAPENDYTDIALNVRTSFKF